MATETQVQITAYGAKGQIEVVASTAKKAIEEFEKFGASASELLEGDVGIARPPAVGVVEESTPTETAKTEDPKPEPKKEEPAPEIDAADVRKKIEALVATGPDGAMYSVTIMNELKAFDEDKNPKLSGLAPENYQKAIDMADAKIAELSQPKGVL